MSPNFQFFVIDTGVGISEEKHAVIFEAFSQADGSVTREYGGTGLGLTIASKLVQMAGGNLAVRSRPGVGTVFHFDCGFGVVQDGRAISAGPLREGAETIASSSRCILVAEDDVINQKIITGFLKHAGHAVLLAANGEEAVALYRNHDVDLILMDVQMSKMGGLEAAAEIRSICGTLKRRQVPIVAVTAHALQGDAEKSLAAGMDQYLPKPIDRVELLKLIERAFAEQPSVKGR